MAVSVPSINAVSAPTSLQGIFSTSPTRSISWQVTDAFGNPALTAQGQPSQRTLYPQIVVREVHENELIITQHPVERGSVISDHAYRMPSRVRIEGGWSYSAGARIIGTTPVFTDPTLLQTLYNTLLQIQQQRAFVTLVTGKRVYQNMLLALLKVETDQHTENILSFEAEFMEILLASTSVVTVPLNPANMANPDINAATTDQGNTALGSGAPCSITAANAILPTALQNPAIGGGTLFPTSPTTAIQDHPGSF